MICAKIADIKSSEEKDLKKLNISEKAAKRAVFIMLGVIVLLLAFMIYMMMNRQAAYTAQTYSMGSYVQQTVYGGDSESAASEAASSIALLENHISWRKDDSDVQKINAAAGETPAEVNEDTMNILESALDICKKSGGAFDISIAPLSMLWNFDESPTSPPSDELIQNLIGKIDYGEVEIDKENMTVSIKDKGYAIDLGAVGKGAACELAVKSYEEYKVDYAIVAVGGSVGVYGEKPLGQSFTIGIRDPESDAGSTIATLSVKSGFTSTSGSYEKCFEYEGKNYFHILDPKTGYPAESDLVSVTVLCDSGSMSDALSTACFVLGYENSLSLLESCGAEAVFIDKEHGIRLTDGIKEEFKLTDDSYTIIDG